MCIDRFVWECSVSTPICTGQCGTIMVQASSGCMQEVCDYPTNCCPEQDFNDIVCLGCLSCETSEQFCSSNPDFDGCQEGITSAKKLYEI